MSIYDFPDNHKPASEHQELPHNIELEQAILGAILIDNTMHERVGETVTAGHFYDPLHARLFEMMGEMIAEPRLANPLTMRGELERLPPITDTLSVPQYVVRLAAEAAAPQSLPAYCRNLVDLAARRAIILTAHDLIGAAYEAPPGVPANDLIAQAEQELFRLGEGQKQAAGQVIELRDAAKDAVERICDAYQKGGTVSGLKTGLVDLDALMGGLQNSDLIIIAGRPAMGKTALALGMADVVAHASTDEDQQHVHFFSLEMSSDQLAQRLISEKTGIAGDKLRRGTITEDELRTVIEQARRVGAGRMTIDQTGGINMATLASRARRVKRQHGTTLLVVDYLQLLSGSGKRNANRVQEITEITTGLKALAKELNVPVIALSQLSRKVEERSDKRPQLSDLRESGSIEQDADIVMFVYREEYYVDREMPDESDSRYADWQARMVRCHGKAEIIIGKQRHGPTGTVNVAFDGRLTRFSNLAGERYAG